MKKETKLQTVKEFCENKEWPTESALRQIILDSNRDENDFQSAFVKIGRRVYVNESEFWECVKKSKSKPIVSKEYIQIANDMKKEYGKISNVMLMRKFKIGFEQAKLIMRKCNA